ncbi:hypothetical protein J2X85_003953 [Microbacterium trichothecenolyticum]|uniref:hypothetical protein n=1 Tax=Microbacterium trichothecenolyticum TaxID=69370 RepID=UPI0028591366|nr:hypothetical protein [Microbacterium trichothecenolyticum]MDR7186892.1 hypothetical protein [Microbacterium trichothecenolyticum]
MSASAPAERSIGDLVATLLLIGFSVGAAVVLFFVSLVWAIGNHDNTVAIVLGGYLPLALAVIGAVAGIVALSRKHRAFWYPLIALVFSIAAWVVAASIAR